ncbi:MAG: hypothetical protein Kow0062_28640 [Acidobacteriota bacterium]
MSRRPSALEAASARGALAAGLARAFTAGLQLVTLAILARLLTPADFGLMAMAAVFLALAQVLADLGLASALIRFDDIDERDLCGAFWVALAAGLALCAAGQLAAPALALLFGEPRVVPLVRVASLALPVAALAIVPEAAAERALRFDRVAVVESAAALAAAAAAIGFAATGWGVWALVFQSLALAAARAVLALALLGFRPRAILALDRLARLRRYARDVFAAGLVGFVNDKAADAIVGAGLGAGALGAFNVGARVTLFPVRNLAAVLARVAFPAFARRQQEVDRLRPAYLRLVRLTALVVFPAMAGLAALAPRIVTVVLGPAWHEAVPVLVALAPVAALAATAAANATVWKALGRTRLLLGWSLAVGGVTIVALLAGLSRGLPGVLAALVAVRVPVPLAGHAISNRLLGLRTRDFALALARPAIAALAMGLAVGAASQALVRAAPVGSAPALALLVAAGIALFGLFALAIARDDLGELLVYARAALGRPDPAESS